MARVTIREIARRAGVSKGAVSYALNGQPGVSAETRARVLKVAEELDWVPNPVARQQLSVARSETFGLILALPAQTLSEEPFYMAFVGGLERVLGGRSYALAPADRPGSGRGARGVPDLGPGKAGRRCDGGRHQTQGPAYSTAQGTRPPDRPGR